MRLGPLFRGTFEVQAGNRPLQGQSKPPVFTGGYDFDRKLGAEKTLLLVVLFFPVYKHNKKCGQQKHGAYEYGLSVQEARIPSPMDLYI